MMVSMVWGSVRQPEVFMITPVIISAVTVVPGATVTAAFMVINRTAAEQWYDPTVILPAGWRQIVPEMPFSVSAHDTVIRLIVFVVPSAAAANEYSIRYRLRDRKKPNRQDSAPMTIVVSAYSSVELSLTESPKFAIAGTVFVTDVLVTNRGNAPCDVAVHVRSSLGFPAVIDSERILLHINESRRIRISVSAEERSDLPVHTLEVEVTPDGDAEKKQRISSQVEIVGREPKSTERYREFPLLLRFREVVQNGAALPQGELSGSGSLNSHGTDRLDILIRSPETQGASLLGQRDEYQLAYRMDGLAVKTGDQTFILSPLTEVGRSATGIGGTVTLGKMSVGAFYNETRWLSPSYKQTGGSLNYRLSKEAAFGINLLRKDEGPVSDIASVRALVSPVSGTMIDLEMGKGIRFGRTGNAFAARVEGTQHWLSYDLRFIDAGSDFNGYYTDMRFMTANLTARASEDIRFISYAAVEKHNRSGDTIQLQAPREEQYQFGAGYTDALSIFFKYGEREELFDSIRLRTVERSIQSRFGTTFSDASVYLNAEYGIRRDLTNAGPVIPYTRLSLFASLHTDDIGRFSSSIDYETVRDTVSREQRSRASMNVNANADLSSALLFSCYLYGSRYFTPPVQTIGVFESSLQYRFPFNHSVRFRTRISTSFLTSFHRDVAYSLEYTIPINFPYERITAAGRLRGTLTDEEGNGIPEALLFIGDEAAVTDVRGVFLFSVLTPGEVYLSIDRSTIGLQNTPSEVMPLMLLIRGGEESVISLSVRKSVSLSGTVDLYGVKERSVLDSLTLPELIGGRADINLQLSNGQEILRRVSDNRGRFDFEDLRAGTWTLSVTGGAVPEYHRVEPDSLVVHLRPGEHSMVSLRIVPEKRSLKILQN
ncbi:MAG: hypothetical protein KA247_00760 [Bacteroidetes bacterium]|nr:hypothetical protein [Bacteroidota bacterium]